METATRSKGENSILQLIDELEEVIEHDMHVFHHAVWVDVDEFFALTNKIRLALPQEIRRAERFVKESGRLTEDAQAQATRIVQEARREAERIVLEAHAKAEQITAATEITRAATAKAKQVMQDAEEHGREIRRGADDYAREVLENLDDYIARVMSGVQRGREKLDTKR